MDSEQTDDPLDIALLNPPGADEEIPDFSSEPLPVLPYRSKGSAQLSPPNPPTNKPKTDESWQAFVWITRKLCFAIGLSFFAAGLGDSLGGDHGGASMMGFGAFLAGVAIPLTRSKK